MSVTVADIRAGLKANLASITNTQILDYMLSNPSPPSIAIYPAGTQYDAAMARGYDIWTFTVQALVGAAVDTAAQSNLDAYLAPTGSTSVKTALESDRTLGGKVDNLHVTSVSGYTLYPPDVLGAEWSVDIYARGT